jgi:hypothetical protein
MNAAWDTYKLAAVVGGIIAVIILDVALVMLVPKRRQRVVFLSIASGYNFLLGGGLLVGLIGTLLGIQAPPSFLSSSVEGPAFQLLLITCFFVGWTGVIFGFGYLQSARGKAPYRTFLLYGGALKYGAFAIGTTFIPLLPDINFFINFYIYSIKSPLPLPYVVLVFGALPNLLCAILFSILYRRSK